MIGKRGSIGQPDESQGGKVLQKKDGNMRPPAEDERVRGADVIWGRTRLVVGNVEAEQLDAGRGTL